MLKARILRLLLVVSALVVLALLAFPAIASAATIVVNTTADTSGGGSCSLRDAIAAANTNQAQGGCTAGSGTDDIQVPAGTYNLSLGQLNIASSLNLVGAGAHSTLINGNGQTQRVLEVTSGTVLLAKTTIEGGNTTSSGTEDNHGNGGGIYEKSGSNLTLQNMIVASNQAATGGGGIEVAGAFSLVNSTIENNMAGLGGGIDSSGPTFSITNSTITGNAATSFGGGLSLNGNGTLTNDTIANNTLSALVGNGAGIYVGSTATVTNTLLANNKRLGLLETCGGAGTITSGGGNLVDDNTCTSFTGAGDQQNVPNPGLGALDTSGLTDVLPLTSGSPAIDAGVDLPCPSVDQLGTTRPQGPHCDIGAVEFIPPPSDYFVSTEQELADALTSAEANGVPATIHLAANSYDIGDILGTVNVDSEPGAEITLEGAGPASTILDGSHETSRVVDVEGSGITTIEGLTVEFSSAVGIYDGGDLVLKDSLVQDNPLGISSSGSGFDVSGSTISDNGTLGGGLDNPANGGIYSSFPQSATVSNTTISGNYGFGLYPAGNTTVPPFHLKNVTIANNPGDGIAIHAPIDAVNTIVADNGDHDCINAVENMSTLGHNLDSDGTCTFSDPSDLPSTSPKLGPLQDNGGPTPTMALLAGSPAIEAGDDSSCPAVDQRGVARPQGAHCDIGAFEHVASESIAFESDRTGNSQIFTMNPGGLNVVQLTHDSSTNTLPSISPDGHTVVYQSTSGGVSQIWAINGDGTDPRQLTSTGSNQQPTFSPDGTKIAFDSNRGGYYELFVMNADGSGQTKVMDTDGAVEGSSWSPDGSQIVFSEDTNGTPEIYTVPVATGIVSNPLTTAATDGGNTNPHWSPDGSKILFVSDRCDPLGSLHQQPQCGGGKSVFLMNTDGSNQQNLTQAPIFDADPAWSPDGSKIAFTRDLGGQAFNVFTANADGTDQVQLTNGGAPSRNSFPNWGTQVGGESLVVNTTADTTQGSCTTAPGACTLRDAIDAANAAGGGTIKFDIPGGPAPTITLTNNLPTITAPVTIDGTTQPATPPDTPGVTIGNNGNISQAGVELGANSDGSVVRGLAIRGIGNDTHDGSAIRVDSNNDTVAGNWVNTGADGSTHWSGDRGIVVTGQGDTIGGISAADANSVVNTGQGILLSGATGTVIEGNLVGLTPDGSALGNQTGIELDNATNSVVGNDDGPGGLGDVQAHPELGNVIAGSGGQGIELTDGTTGSIVAGNFIGVDASGAATGQNQRGIYISASSGNQIGPGNTIAHSFEDGIRIDGFLGTANGNRIVANSIFDSGSAGFGGLGIDLQSGGNDTMPSPFVNGVTGGTVSGSYSGDGGGNDFFYEAFVSPSCSGQYANGAGKTYVNFEESGPGTFGIPLGTVTPGEGVTVTVTDKATDDTSEFSNCVTVGGGGTLSGSLSNTSQQNANLTTLGTQDWAVWGYANNGTSTSLTPDVRKAGGSGISDLTDIHQNGAPLRGLGQFAGQLPFSFDWSDGTVPPSATGAGLGLQHDGQPGLVGANGDGFSFTVPADTTQRTLTIYTSAHWATGTLTATLSDGSAQPYTNTVVGTSAPDAGNAPGVFTIDYAAGSPGQHLTVSWTETAATCPQFGCDNAGIYAVALAGSSSGNVTPASAGLGSAGTVAMSGSVPTSDIPLSAFDPQPPGAPPITLNGLQLANTQLANTQLANTQLANTQLANTQLANTQLAHTQLANTQLANTQLANTQLANTQLANTQLASTQLANTPLVTQLANTQLAHTQLANTGLALNTVPLNPTLYPDGWAGLLQGTTLDGQPLQTISLHDVLSLTAADVPHPPSPETAGDVIAKLQSLSFAGIELPSSTLGQVTVGALALGGAEVNDLGGDLKPAIENQLQSWCQSVVSAGDPHGFCSGANPVMGDLSLIQLGLLGAPVSTLQLANTQLANTELLGSQLANTQLANTQLANTPLATSASGIVGMQLANTDLASPDGIGGLFVSQFTGDVNALFDCSKPSNFDCSSPTATLADAQRAGAIKPGTTLGDLDAGDYLSGVSIAQLLATVLGSDSAYRDTVNFGDLVGLFLRNSDVDWESLSPDVLTIFDPNRQSLSLTADFSFQGTGTSGADVKLNLPAGFDYAPGSATLSKNGGSSSSPGDPTIVNTPNGLELDWHFDSVDAGSSYELKFGAYSGTTAGPAQATETVTAGGQSSSSIRPFSVITSNAHSGTGTAADPTSIDTTSGHDSVEMSALPTAGAVDYYTIPTPAAGTRISVHLTNLPADYDLALYATQSTSVRTTSGVDPSAPPLQDGVVPDTQVNLNGGSSGQLTPTGLEDVPDPGLPLRQLSDNRRTDAEDVGMVSPGTGQIEVAVFGYNRAFSPKAYTLRVRETPAPSTQICSARTLPGGGTPGSLPNSLPTDLNTIILVNEQRLGDTYGSGAETTAVTALNSLAADRSLGVSGVVVPVEGISGVPALYHTWDSNPCSPDAANAIANSIADEVDSIVAQRPTVKYVVFAGGDDQIPFFRLPDLSLIANESGFAGQFGANEYGGSLAAGDLLSDDPYLDTQPVPAGGQQLFPPNLSGGRLVETPGEIAAAVTSFESAHGALKSSTGFVSGYDFVADGSKSVASNLRANGVSVNTLIDDPLHPPLNLFGSSDLLNAAFPPNGSGTPADINSWNGHYDNYRAQMSNGQIISTSDLPGGLNGGVFFTMGCHAGFQTTDAVVGSTVLDWPQYFAEHDTGFVGNTGFGLGDTDSVAFSEQLMADFAGQINGSNSLGAALLQAKQQYYLSRVAFSNYDEKALSEAELYGLPMYGIGQAPRALAALSDPSPDPVTGASASTSPSQGSLSTFAGSGVQSANFDVTPSFSSEQHGQNGDFFTNAGQVQAPNYRPLQPYVSLPAGRTDSPGLYAHGVVVDSLTSQDTTGFTPDNVRPIVNSSADEPPPSFQDESWPEKIPTLVSLGQNQNLNLATGQFFTQGSGGVERLWTQIDGRVTYSTSQDFTPPTIDSIDAVESHPGHADDILGFTGRFSDLDQNGHAGTVAFAQVVYDDGAGNWQAVQLQKGSTGLWSAGVPFAALHVQYFVEACDAAGNCGYSSNKGDYFDAQALPSGSGSGGSGGTVTISPNSNVTPIQWHTGSFQVSATTTAPQPATVSISVDGGAPTTGPVTLSGDGVHVVVARDSAGNVASAAYLIDTTGPTITHTVSPAAPDGTNGWYKTAPTVTFNCSDNLSGVATCLANGGPGNKVTLSGSASSQSATGTATDNAGNASGPVSVSGLKVDTTAPVGGSISVTAGYSTTTMVPVSVTNATDPESGMLSNQVQRQSASLTGGSCGPFGAWSPVTLVSGKDTTVTSGSCVEYRLVATDNAGLVTNDGPTGIVKVDTTGPMGGSISVTAGYSTTTMVPVSVTNATDPESGVSNQVQRKLAPLTGGSCGTFDANWSNVSLVSGKDTVPSGKCVMYQLSSTNGAGVTVNVGATGTVKVDTTGPVGGTISVTAGYSSTNLIAVSVTNANDPESGMLLNQVQRKLATLSNGSCGTFDASWSNVTLAAGTDTVSPGKCVEYQLVATDNAGLTTTYGPTGVVKVRLNPTITWNAPASILFGTKLSSTQLNATASVAGSFAYTPAAGTLLQPGVQTLVATFTPTSPDYNVTAASRTITVGFSQACLTGSLSGSLTIKSGTAYCIQGGKVSGSITVQSGGSLYIGGGSVSGPITSSGATALTLCGTSVSGSISISSSSGLVQLGGPSGSGCAANALSSSITLTGNTAGVTVVGNTISGPVTASSNKGVLFSGNKVSGSITVNGNSGGVTFTNNTVSGNVTITNNTGGFTYSGNVISGTVTLKNNS
jgi:CSLREA domain-containing protein